MYCIYFIKRSSEFLISTYKISTIPIALAYSRNVYNENSEYNVPFTKVLTYILSCSNNSFKTGKTSSLGSSHFFLP